MSENLSHDKTPESLPPIILDRESLEGKRIRFVGYFGSMSQRAIARLVREYGVRVATSPLDPVDWIILGDRRNPLTAETEAETAEKDWLAPEIRDAVDEGRIRLATESQLLQQLFPAENQKSLTSLYTPLMLAELLGVTPRAIRRWMMEGFISPARTVKRLPYFDLQEVFSAQRLASLLNRGVSAGRLERQLKLLRQLSPHFLEEMAESEFIVDGQKLYIRHGEKILEPTGQFRLDFPDAEPEIASTDGETGEISDALSPAEMELLRTQEDVLRFLEHSPSGSYLDAVLAAHHQDLLAETWRKQAALDAVCSGEEFSHTGEENSLDMFRKAAMMLADSGENEKLERAEEIYRTILLATEPRADDCFELGDILYRLNDLSAARERFSMAVELEEDFVEARVSLGCVLEEMGHTELAVSALEGAIAHHPDYADAYYHLAKVLDGHGRETYAEDCRQRFLTLVDPHCPTAEEMRNKKMKE